MNDLLNLAIKAHGGLERWRPQRALAQLAKTKMTLRIEREVL